MVREYSNDDIIVKWQSKKCRHAAVSVKALPKVYNPNNKPCITVENATTKELKNQINNCPMGL